MKPHGIVTVCLAFAVSAALPVAEASESSLAKVFGKIYGEWSAAWWQWAVSIPASESPVLLTDDDLNFDCSLGQHGPVWFLAGLPEEFEDFDKFIGDSPFVVPERRSCGGSPDTASLRRPGPRREAATAAFRGLRPAVVGG
jgi:hypothetical protein